MSNSATSETHPILDKIHSKGYWRVVIRPTIFEPTRIESIPALESLIRGAVVALRGWDYPHIGGRKDLKYGQDYFQGITDYQNYIEYFRLFQSGQFIHHFAMREDYVDKEGKWLRTLSTLFTFTEIYEFAARLASTGVLVPEVKIEVSLHDLDERTLYGNEFFPSRDFTCNVDKLSTGGEYPADALLKNCRCYAAEACTEIFHRFGWTRLNANMLHEDQRKLLEKRI